MYRSVLELYRIRVFLAVPKVLSLNTASGLVPDLALHRGVARSGRYASKEGIQQELRG